MTELSVTARCQVTLAQEVLRHLGIERGEHVELEWLPNARAGLKGVPQKGTLRALHGFLKGKTNGKVLSLDEIDGGISEAGAAASSGGNCSSDKTPSDGT